MSLPETGSERLMLAAIRDSNDRAEHVERDVLLLFDRYRNPLLRYVGSFGLEMRDAEDVVQDVFLALFSHLQRNGARENLVAWLFSVAHNLALKHRARDLRRRRAGEASGTPAADLASDPEQLLAADQRRDRLLSVVNALPERDRQCLALRAEGFRYREIARRLRMSLGAVSKSLARSVMRLKRADEV
jgi:RNA polymerase sigma-70 factor (ECF subfamily)